MSMLGCQEPDLSAVRADLVTNAKQVCAAPVARPTHAAAARVVARAAIEDALVKLCEQNEAHAPASPELLDVLHQGLVQGTAIVGELRRSRVLLDAPKVDLAASQRCGAAWVGLDRQVLAAAKAQHEAGHVSEAYALCADVIALARDEDLQGGLTELLLANSEIQRAVAACRPLLAKQATEESIRFGRTLTVLRAAFPRNLDGALQRDRAEMILGTFGKVRDPAQPLGCERAESLAKAGDGNPLTRSQRVDLERAWQAARKEHAAPDPRYFEAYDLTLRALDGLIAQAKGE